MHKLKILISAPDSFIKALNELSEYFKFKFSPNQNPSASFLKDYDGIICHELNSENKEFLQLIEKSDCFKILASLQKSANSKFFDQVLSLPTTPNELNNIVESCAAKKNFSKNSSIKIKEYSLNKNEKKLVKNEKFIILTEKEVQLLELFLNKKKPVSKSDILSEVWKYATDADTHTVETHIYRLRKKINEKFSDEKFIINSKEGYFF